MNPIRSLVITALLFTSLQTCVLADAITHKDALIKAQKASDTTVVKVKNSAFYPTYHIASPANFMGQPNGLAYFNGMYHLFYQQNPYSAKQENLHWGHLASPDMINWKELPIALAPSEDYDSNSTLSGSAIVEDELLYLIYTGDIAPNETNRHQTQNLAMSKDGINFGKSANNAIIKMAPHYSGYVFSSKDFRNPYVWKQSGDYYALVGTQYETTKDGALLLYKSKDLRNWVFINITAIGSKGEMGEVWEHPAFLHIGDDDVLIISTEGIKPQGKNFLNKYKTGWFVGKLDYNSGNFKQKGPFGVFDKGFDFYAPQVIKTTDNRYALIASLDTPDSAKHESKDGWAGMMTVPREIKIVDGKVLTTPLADLKTLRDNGVTFKNIKLNSTTKEFNGINGEAYELLIDADLTAAKSFSVKLRTSSTHETVLSYDKETNILKLDRDKSGHGLSGQREAEVSLTNNKLKLQIFVDKSSIEVFANGGQVVMSSRIYPDKNSTGIKFVSEGEVKIDNLDFYKLKNIYNK